MSVHVSDRLSAYLDGELSVVDAGGVRQHLASCDACSAELLELAAVDRAVRGLPVTAPDRYFDTFAPRVRTRIESSGRARGGRGLPRWTWALAAALLLAVILPRIPWDRAAPAARPAASHPADKDDHLETDSFARAQPSAAPATFPPAPLVVGRDEEESLRRQGPGRLDEKQPSSIVDQPKAEAAPSPGKARGQYAEPPPKAAALSTAETRVAPEQQPQAPAPSARTPAAAASYTGAAAANAAPAEAEKLSADFGLGDEAAAGVEGAVAEEPRAKEQLEKKAERPARAQPGSVAAGRSGALHSLDSRVARSLEERRALREAWRKFARDHPEDPRADEARVRVVALGAEIARETSKSEDVAQLRADGTAYLARADARQKERVKALLVEFDR